MRLIPIVTIILQFVIASSISGCKARKKNSATKSTDESCNYNDLNANSNKLLSQTTGLFDQFYSQSISRDQADAEIRAAIAANSSSEDDRRQLAWVALNFGQMRLSEKVLPIVLKNIAGYGATADELKFLSRLDLPNPQRYIEMVSMQYEKYYRCVETAGLRIAPNGNWDFSKSNLSVQSIAANSCLKTAMNLFFGGTIATERSLQTNEAIVIGENVVSSCKDYSVRSKGQWNQDVNRNLDGFKVELSNFLSASGAGSSYSEWMKGRYRDYAGTRPHEIEKDGSYNAMLKYRDMLRCLGVNSELMSALGEVMAAALKIDAANIQAGIAKLNSAEMAAVAAPIIPLVIYAAPIIGGSMVGTTLGATIGVTSAKMALLPIAFGSAISIINTSIDTVGHGGSWMCKFGEELATSGSGSLIMAPFMASLPIAPALVGGGTAYISSSAMMGTTVYGASNIVLALGFIGKMGYGGITEIQQCRATLTKAHALNKSAVNQNDVNEVNILLTEATKQCVSGGIDIAFAVSGGVALGTIKTKVKIEIKTEKDLGISQAVKLSEFTANSDKPTGGPLFQKLPEGLPADYIPGLNAIRELMRNKTTVFKLMQALESEVFARAQKEKIANYDALVKILAETEQKNGFKPAVDLQPKPFTSVEWMQMLSEGALFRDINFTDAARKGQPHGRDTHRIQWNVVMRFMEMSPQKFGGKTPVELFKMLGDVPVSEKLNWENTGRTGGQSIWSPFFDSFERNFSSPEWFRSQHEMWPGLGDWY